MKTLAQLIAHELAAAQVKYVFGLPGGETLDLMEGLRQEGLRFVLVRHETSGAFMASTLGELTGVPGVCLATLGPGATNLTTGIAHAFLDGCPVIAITAQLSADRFPLNPHQALDIQAIFRPITKWRASITPANAAHVTQKALRIAAEDRPGPVLLEVGSDLPKQAAELIATPFPSVTKNDSQIRPTNFDETHLERVAALFRSSRRPVVMIGKAALPEDAAEILTFCQWLGGPVADMPKAKGVFPELHPLFAGTLEMMGSAALFRLLDHADLIVAIGMDAVELDRPWVFKGPVVAVSRTVNTDWQFPSHFEIVGPIGRGLHALRMISGEPTAPWSLDEIGSIRREVLHAVEQRGPGQATQDVLSALRRVLPSSAILATDTGAHKDLAGQVWRTESPRTYLVSNGLSSMGYALPAIIAAKLACPDRICAAVMGDGGFGMVLAEIETAVRERAEILCVVLVDGVLGSIHLKQRRREYPSYGTTLTPADYAVAAKALGAHVLNATGSEDYVDLFERALERSGPTVVIVPVSVENYP